MPSFYLVLGIQTQLLGFVQQACYPVSQLPSPKVLFLMMKWQGEGQLNYEYSVLLTPWFWTFIL